MLKNLLVTILTTIHINIIKSTKPTPPNNAYTLIGKFKHLEHNQYLLSMIPEPKLYCNNKLTSEYDSIIGSYPCCITNCTLCTNSNPNTGNQNEPEVLLGNVSLSEDNIKLLLNSTDPLNTTDYSITFSAHTKDVSHIQSINP